MQHSMVFVLRLKSTAASHLAFISDQFSLIIITTKQANNNFFQKGANKHIFSGVFLTLAIRDQFLKFLFGEPPKTSHETLPLKRGSTILRCWTQ